jgi:hypothetical protein
MESNRGAPLVDRTRSLAEPPGSRTAGRVLDPEAAAPEPSTASASFLERWAHTCGAALNRPWFSVAVVITMLVIGYAVRRSALPTASLWFDDAWVAVGAIHFTPSQLFAAGSAHPGFTITLRLFHDLFAGDVGRLAYVPFLAGWVAAPCMYLWLRSLRFARSISLLLAAPLVIGKIPVLYSGRVKPYTLDVVLVIAVFVALPRLAAKTWRWPTWCSIRSAIVSCVSVPWACRARCSSSCTSRTGEPVTWTASSGS